MADIATPFHPTTAVAVSPSESVTEGAGTDVTLQCSAHSKPAGNIAWYHNGQVIRIEQLSPPSGDNRYTRTRTITSARRQAAGVYKCVATNTIAPPDGDTSNTASVKLIVRYPPVIIRNAQPVRPVAINLGVPSTFSVTYYSNVAGRTVTCHRVVNNVTQTSTVGEVINETSQIQLPVYDSVVTTQGTTATFTLTLNSESELVAYYVKITNTAGTTVVYRQTVPEDPPETLKGPMIEEVHPTSVNVSWNMGFHGGLCQTFVVQYSTDGEAWTNGGSLDTGNSSSGDRHFLQVDSLSPGQLYFFSIHAYNSKGPNPYNAVFNVTTSAIDGHGHTASVTGPAVGGSVAALIVIALVVGLVVLHGKGYSIKMSCKKKNKYR